MLRATATMASRRSIDIYALLLTAVLLFHLSRQDSGAARLPPCHSQQHGTVDAPLGPVRASGSDRILLVNEEARCHGIDTSTMAREPAIRVQSSTTAAPTADSSAVPAADAACSTDNPPETESTRHLLQQQVLLYSSNSSSPATAVPEASALAEVLSTFRAGCTSRPAFRMFVPTSVQSTQSTISIVLQLIQPSAALQLWQLFDTSACGTAYNCFLTAQPPAEVIADSLEVSEAEGVGRISIKLPKVGSVLVAASLSLTLKADPCNELGTAANFSVPIYAGAPRGALVTLTAPILTNSTFTIGANFGREISGFDVSRMRLGNISSISTIVRSNHTSFVMFCDGVAEKTAKLQLQDGSFFSSTYSTGNSTSTLEVHMPGLQETLPFYATAAQTILPIALGVSGFACILAIFVVPGTPLATCAPSLIRALSHLQVLAASAGISRAAGGGGFPSSYAAAAGRLSWALLDWFPSKMVEAINKNWVQLLASYPPPDNGTWTPAPPDGTKLDSWLADIQNTSALMTAYDVASSTGQQKQLQQLALAARADAPQLPLVINLSPSLQGLASSSWSGLVSSCEVAVCLLIGAGLVHILLSVIASGSWRSPMKRNSVIRVAPATVHFPLLMLVALLLTLPAILHWVGCLIAAKQQFWMVFAGVLSVGVVAGTLYVWMLQKVLTTAQSVLQPRSVQPAPAAPTAPSAAGSTEVELLTLDGLTGQAKFIKMARQSLLEQQQQQQHMGRSSRDVSMLQQQYPGDAVTVVRHSGSHNGQRAYLQQQQQQGGYPIAEAAVVASASEHQVAAHAAAGAAAELDTASRSGSATLLEAVTSTLQEYQQRLQQFSKSRAYLSLSGRSWSLQQQQQGQAVQEATTEPSLASGSKLAAAELHAHTSACSKQQQAPDKVTAQQEPSGSSSSSRPVAEASELPSSTVDEDVERLQQEEVLREHREARRRAKVRKQLRQQRMRSDAVIQPRPLPPDPPELTAFQESRQASVAAVVEGSYKQEAAIAGILQGPLKAVTGGYTDRSGNVYDSWDVSSLQQQQQQQQYARAPSKAGSKASAAAAPAEADGWFTKSMAFVGLLQGQGSQVQLGNAVVEQRLTYMARYGVLLWDVTGSVGSANPQDEARLAAGTSRNALLVANIVFAIVAGASCILYGSIGPSGVFEPQIWGIALVQIVWLVYVVGLNPICEVLVTAVEVLVTTGQVLIGVCALMGIVQGEAVMGKTRTVSLCCLAGMVLFITVIECIRALMLAVSAWYAVQHGGRRRKRVAPLV